MARTGTLQETFYPTEEVQRILDDLANKGIKKSQFINQLILEAAGKLPVVRISDDQMNELVTRLKTELK